MYDPKKHHRRSIRLRWYAYSSPGAYFVTICVADRSCLLGDINDGMMSLSPVGDLVLSVWNGLPQQYPHVELDAFQIMPNHVHGVIWLVDHNAQGQKVTMRQHGLGEIIRAFKSFSAREINRLRDMKNVAVWQRNYFEHVIRDDEALELIRQYIVGNPQRWDDDKENPLGRRVDDVEVWVEQFETKQIQGKMIPSKMEGGSETRPYGGPLS